MYHYKARIIRVIDGDTMWMDVDLGMRIHTQQSVRVLDLDTPEIFRTYNQAEKMHGMKAKEKADDLFSSPWSSTANPGPYEVEIHTHKSGKYGRWLARITLPDGRDFAEEMKRAGMEKKERY